MAPAAAFFWVLCLILCPVQAQTLDGLIDEEIPALLSAYKWLHAHPELSHYEKKTAAFVAGKLREMGFSVTENFGTYELPNLSCHGIVGVVENGPGPTVLVRTDLDALPVEEKTGLPYASKVRAKNEEGKEVGVMHACGHDLHMSVFLGTAKVLSRLKDQWSGTLLAVAQPAEEMGTGSKAMLRGGLYTRFPLPDYAIALHDDASMAAGKIGFREGFFAANVDSVNLTIRGMGGHGALPHLAKDPIVIASQVIVALQTIVSRETSPLDSAVVTVGSIHGGTKHNIIPDEVKLEITVRTYKKDVRKNTLSSIERIAMGSAFGAGVPNKRKPIMEVQEAFFTPAVYNNPALTRRLVKVWRDVLGSENVVESEPSMAGEDFARYSLEGYTIPACLFWLGAADPEKVEKSRKRGTPLPPLHSAHFSPLPEPAIRTGVKAMSSAILELLKKEKGSPEDDGE